MVQAVCMFAGDATDTAASTATVTKLTDEQAAQLGEWLQKDALPKRLSKVKVGHCHSLSLTVTLTHCRLQATTRLKSSPAVVTDHESASLRRMMRMLNQVCVLFLLCVLADAAQPMLNLWLYVGRTLVMRCRPKRRTI